MLAQAGLLQFGMLSLSGLVQFGMPSLSGLALEHWSVSAQDHAIAASQM